MKVYDTFLFFNEIDLLEIRLNELNELVDYFVVVEGDITFSGLYKGYTLEKSKERLKKFWHKIIYLKSDISSCAGRNVWKKESYQRNFITKSSVGMKDDDIIIVSDVDEIPSKIQLKEAIGIVLKNETPITLNISLRFYYLNNKAVKTKAWLGPVIAKRGTFKGAQQLRENRAVYPKFSGTKPGWHFTYCSKEGLGIDKIRAYSHFKEFASVSQEVLEKTAKEGGCFFDKNMSFVKDNNLPECVLENKKKFKKLLIHKEKRHFFFFKKILL